MENEQKDPTPFDETTADRSLEDLVAEYVSRLNNGETILPEQIRFDHPRLADEVLSQIGAFVSLGAEPKRTLGTLGDYTLRREIGRGGMGVVYEAWQSSLDRRVALKVLPAGIAADNKAFVRFMREAKTAAQLSHPNVVGVHSVGLEKDTPYYAMECVEGETLAQILAKTKDIEFESETVFGPKDQVDYFVKLARAFADVADGLQHAHSKGVVHRDIKPSNLILDGEGQLRILDFGLARLEGQESLTVSGDLMGTVLYMSPEQAMAKRVPLDHRTDVYSLGATMYEVLTGQPPFRGKDQHDTLSRIIVRDPRPLWRLNSRVPADLETIVLKCLRKDAGDRYGTAEALGQDLRRFVRGDPVEARPESAAEKFTRQVRRYKGRLVVSGVFLLLCTVCGTLYYQLWDAKYQLWDAERRGDIERATDDKRRKLASVLKTRSGDAVEVFRWRPGGKWRNIGSHCKSRDELTLYYNSDSNLWRARRRQRHEPFAEAEALPSPINSTDQEWFPTLSPDERWFYFTSTRGGQIAIYAAARHATGDLESEFGPPFRLQVAPEGSPSRWMGCVSHDEEELYFQSVTYDLWVASFNDPGNPQAGFRDARALTRLNSPHHQEMRPVLSRDGTMLFFSDRPRWQVSKPPRPGGNGRSDLWVAVRCHFQDGSFGPWDEPQPLRFLNTDRNEFSPWLSADGTTLSYTGSGSALYEVPLVALACLERPLRARRTIHVEETARLNRDERPIWNRGRSYRVTLELTDVRPASELCGPTNEVVIEETVPKGWTPRHPSNCGEITEAGQIQWRLRRGACGAAGFPSVLSYEVLPGGEMRVASFSGTIVEYGSPAAFSVEGDAQLFSGADFSREGFIRRWLLLGPYQVPGDGCEPLEERDLRVGYLAGGQEAHEGNVVPLAGEGVATAATEGATVRPDMRTWQEWFAEDDLVDFGAYYGAEKDRVVMYAATYVHIARSRGVEIGLSSDDAVQVFLNGVEILINNEGRNIGGRGNVHDRRKVTLVAGSNLLLVKVFNYCTEHYLRLRFQDAETGEPLTGEDGIRVCVDSEDCGDSKED